MSDPRCIRTVVALIVLLFATTSFSRDPQNFLYQGRDGVHYFHGTIDSLLEISMVLRKHDKQLDGEYMYATHQQPIPLKGEVSGPAEYRLDEFTAEGRITAHFKLSELAGAGNPVGTWETADGKRKLSVVIGEITDAQHELLLKLWQTKPKMTALSIGGDHSCIIRTLGASCWGIFPGMPGLATNGPAMVAKRALPNLLFDDTVLAVSTSSRRVCLLQSESMRCADRASITEEMRDLSIIPGFERNVTMLGADDRYSCAVVAGALKCWDGSSKTPSSVATMIPTGVDRLSSGSPHCAVMTAGSVKCWSFQHDPEQKQNRLVTQEISGLAGEIRSLSSVDSAEERFACAVDTQGLKCWGDNFSRQLGNRPGGVRNLPPAPLPGLETGVTAVSMELNHSCAIKEGKVYCWGGFNYLGELGDKKPKGLGEVIEVSGIDNASQIGVGPFYSCALTSDLRVFCWGDNEFGQTGNDSHDVGKQPNGPVDSIDVPCNRYPVEVRGLR